MTNPDLMTTAEAAAYVGVSRETWLRRAPRGGWGHPTKGIIANKFMRHDGSLGGEVVLDASAIEYLEGAASHGDKETVTNLRELIDAITEHGAILVWLEA